MQYLDGILKVLHTQSVCKGQKKTVLMPNAALMQEKVLMPKCGINVGSPEHPALSHGPVKAVVTLIQNQTTHSTGGSIVYEYRLGKWSQTDLIQPLTSCNSSRSADPDQMPCSAASDLGLHCLSMSQFRFFR